MRVTLARSTAAVAGVTVSIVAVLLALNGAPRGPLLSSAMPATATQPYVIRLHARWCPICFATRGAWAATQAAYTGKVNFVVFDFTSDASTESSRAMARQIGLDGVFNDHEGETGGVLVVDGASKTERESLHGVLTEADYRVAIDAALATGTRAR
jgi:hypothetical protein